MVCAEENQFRDELDGDPGGLGIRDLGGRLGQAAS